MDLVFNKDSNETIATLFHNEPGELLEKLKDNDLDLSTENHLHLLHQVYLIRNAVYRDGFG